MCWSKNLLPPPAWSGRRCSTNGEDGLTCDPLDRWENGEDGDLYVTKFGEVFAERCFALVEDVTVQLSDIATPFMRSALEGLNPTYIRRTKSFNRF